MSIQHAAKKCQAVKMILVLVVVLCFASLINAAAVNPFKVSERVQRSAENTDDSERDCEHLVCGWAIYNRDTRYIESYMRNQCRCAEGYKCIRTGDVLIANAFEYHCLRSTSSGIEFPPYHN